LENTKDMSLQNLHGNTLLHLYASTSISRDDNDFKLLETIAKNTNHINTPNSHGNTPIFEVGLEKNIDKRELAMKFVSYGADVHVLNNEGESPLHIAVTQGNFNYFSKIKGNELDVYFLISV
jgi:ankyrin repeat protein